MTREEIINEIASICAKRIEGYEIRVQLALNTIDRNRCTLSQADISLCSQIEDKIDEWGEDHDTDMGYMDITAEEILFTEV